MSSVGAASGYRTTGGVPHVFACLLNTHKVKNFTQFPNKKAIQIKSGKNLIPLKYNSKLLIYKTEEVNSQEGSTIKLPARFNT